jgi:hypothetical protein
MISPNHQFSGLEKKYGIIKAKKNRQCYNLETISKNLRKFGKTEGKLMLTWISGGNRVNLRSELQLQNLQLENFLVQ